MRSASTEAASAVADAARTARAPALDRDTTDAARGVFILLVILHHSAAGIALDQTQRSLLEMIVTFHVAGFFLLSAVTRSSFDLRVLAQRVLVPYWIFLLFYWVLFNAWSGGGIDGGDVGRLAAAALLPTPARLESATGLLALWFLPCFFLFLVISAGVRRLEPRWRAAALAAAFVVGALLVGWRIYLPYFVAVALFCAGLGGAVRALLASLEERPRDGVLLAAVLVCLAVMVGLHEGAGIWANFAILQTSGAGGMLRLPLIALFILAAFVMVLALCELGLKRLPWLVHCGRISLELYLVHLLFMSLTKVLVAKTGTADLPVMALGRFAVIVLVTLAVIRLMPRRLQRIVFVR